MGHGSNFHFGPSLLMRSVLNWSASGILRIGIGLEKSKRGTCAQRFPRSISWKWCPGGSICVVVVVSCYNKEISTGFEGKLLALY